LVLLLLKAGIFRMPEEMFTRRPVGLAANHSSDERNDKENNGDPKQ